MTSKEYQGRFDVDTEGFRNQMSELQPYRLMQELIANTFDEDSVKDTYFKVDWNEKTRQVEVLVTDDGNGFRNIKEVFSLFGRSYKRGIPTKSGKFNLGEKEFMAVAETGYVRSRDWKVSFYEDKRKEDTELTNFDGTSIFGTFKWPKKSVKEAIRELNKVIVPKDKKLFINNQLVKPKKLVRSIKGILKTEIEDEETGKMLSRTREADIDLYQLEEDETAMLFEIGIPVQNFEKRTDMLWNVDVRQKVPVGIKRDVVSDAWLVDLYVILVEECHDLISIGEASSTFVMRSMSKVSKETARDIVKKKYGTENVYISSQSDSDANEGVNSVGGQFIGNEMNRYEKEHLKDLKILKNATEDFGSSSASYSNPVEPNEQMKYYANIVKAVARDVLHKEITIQFVNSDATKSAWYGMSDLTYNLEKLGGKKFFDEFSVTGIGLLVHELSHNRKVEGQIINLPHSAPEFLEEMERIGGEIGKVGIDYWINKVKLNGIL